MLRVILWGALVSVVAGVAYVSGLADPIDDRLIAGRFDRGERLPSGSVVVADIDAASLTAIGTWPWPRQVYADLIDRLMAAGAAEIAIDIDFSAFSTPEGDAALEAALRRAGGSVILAVFQQQASAASGTTTVNRPIPDFQAQSWPGTVNVRPDPDGAIRSFAYGEWLGTEPVPSIPALLAGAAGDLGTSFLVDYSITPLAIDRIPVADILSGAVDPARLAGRKVIIGASAVELRDLYEVPVYGIIPGSLLLAVATETLIQGRALNVPPDNVVFAGLAILMLLLLVAARFLRFATMLVGFAFLAVLIEVAASVLQSNMPMAVPTAAWHLALLGFAIVVTGRELDLRQLLASIFRAESRNNRALLDRFVEDSFSGMIIATGDGKIVSASTSALRILSLTRGHVPAGSPFAAVLPDALASAMADGLKTLTPGSGRRCDIRFELDGETRVLDATIAMSLLDNAYRRGRKRGSEEPAITATFLDVTEVRSAEARNSYLARHDDLTRLPNRAYFTEQLRDLTERRQAGGVLFFDLDRFKLVNDALGHHVGDLLLTAVGSRALEAIAGKGFLARFGGDEYAILAPGLTPDRLAELAGKLIEALSAPFDVDGHRVAVGATVGIAVVTRKATDPAAPMREADLALNAAKDAGGNGYCFFEARMDNAPKERRVLEVALWDAIERDQFKVAYQPQIDLATGRLSGVEALIRWVHPTLGPLSPASFIPVAESTGLISTIGTQVLRRACREIAGISPDLRLAVNVSPVQFTRGDLVGTVKDALAESGLDPKRLDIEITESLFVHSGSLLEETIRKLKALGVGFALDDFGTGYSSLSYLRRFPIDKIKIDRSFVTGLPFDPDSAGIVRAIAAMANAMAIDFIAEGVETAEQVAFLKKLGCQEGQGFLFGRAESLEVLSLASPTRGKPRPNGPRPGGPASTQAERAARHNSATGSRSLCNGGMIT